MGHIYSGRKYKKTDIQKGCTYKKTYKRIYIQKDTHIIRYIYKKIFTKHYINKRISTKTDNFIFFFIKLKHLSFI